MTKIIALIGIDGSGKTTQARLLYYALRKRKFKVKIIYAGNTGVSLGRKFSFYLSLPIDIILHRLLDVHDNSALLKYRTFLRLKAFLLFLNYLILVLPKILFYGRMYRVLIADRYVYDYIVSTILQKKYFRSLIKILLRIVPKPKVTLLLDVDSLIALHRKNAEKTLGELRLLRSIYLHLIANMNGIIIDASKSKIETFRDIMKIVKPSLEDI